MKITKKHIGRPIDLTNNRGETMHGRVSRVKRGYASIVDIYIDGVHTKENGAYNACVDVKGDPFFPEITIN